MDNTNQLLYVTVKNPSGTQYQGHAESVTSYNNGGIFDVMGYHTNFISLIKNAVIIHEKEKKDITIPVENGIIKVYENTVTVFLGITSVS